MDKWKNNGALLHALWIAGCLILLGLGLLLQTPPPAPAKPPPLPEGPLSGRVIAVDPGHGGYDGGARAPNNGQWEKVYNLQIAQRLESALRAQGARVLLTRDADYALCDADPPIRKKRQDMERRAQLVLEGGAELLLSIHMNEFRDSRQSGPQVFFSKERPEDRALAGHFQQILNDALTPARPRSALSGDFYMLALGMPSVLVECGFLSNPAEEALLRDPAYQQRLAEALCQGVLAWLSSAEAPPEILENPA